MFHIQPRDNIKMFPYSPGIISKCFMFNPQIILNRKTNLYFSKSVAKAEFFSKIRCIYSGFQNIFFFKKNTVYTKKKIVYVPFFGSEILYQFCPRLLCEKEKNLISSDFSAPAEVFNFIYLLGIDWGFQF